MKDILEDYDFIIDVRTPSEYAHSHIPNAINLAVLNDDEYVKIGTIYKQESPLKAKILGASIACKNISKILDSIPKDKALQTILNHKNKLLIYCARGGQRSESLCVILNHIGFRVKKLENGYKGYRNKVVEYFSTPMNHFFLTLCGHTGCGKTEIIQSQEKWSINLEALAHHYGSSFGNMASLKGYQPTQKMFENRLFEEFCKKAPEKILLIEAESRKLGKIIIPHSLFKAYQDKIIILVQSDLSLRIQRIVKMYQNIPENEFFIGMEKIKPYISKNIFSEILTLWEKKDLNKIAEILIVKYYDKVYRIPKYTHIITNNNMHTSIQEILEIKKYYESILSNKLEFNQFLSSKI
ncbi:tRNA 2-selenouridine(34) synthase MnmH [Helicobacter sp. 12S02232-10]|uniref:tRNA 2-selenouridine(34) synthase MnmH n=1 Tax=Helicobacter sp. 12S02232-10 TaxID=1476197 RepID=UPI000BA50D8D|nr:tRNA 2-selenouridine(34) synthase MnmH [Helicobacter sp. 12S02232-10]PAF48887.1 tRNA 2-selenouridine(34) synthase MnmH [Helicobacter sp. 12S02232-10]